MDRDDTLALNLSRNQLFLAQSDFLLFAVNVWQILGCVFFSSCAVSMNDSHKSIGRDLLASETANSRVDVWIGSFHNFEFGNRLWDFEFSCLEIKKCRLKDLRSDEPSVWCGLLDSVV